MAKRGPKGPSKYTEEFLKKEAKNLIDWFMEVKDRVWLKDWAIERGYPADYVTRFSERSDEFCKALKRAKMIQEARIYKGALSGQFNTAMAIFGLKNVDKWGTGTDEKNWADRQDLNVTGDVNVNVVNYADSDGDNDNTAS